MSSVATWSSLLSESSRSWDEHRFCLMEAILDKVNDLYLYYYQENLDDMMRMAQLAIYYVDQQVGQFFDGATCEQVERDLLMLGLVGIKKAIDYMDIDTITIDYLAEKLADNAYEIEDIRSAILSSPKMSYMDIPYNHFSVYSLVYICRSTLMLLTKESLSFSPSKIAELSKNKQNPMLNQIDKINALQFTFWRNSPDLERVKILDGKFELIKSLGSGSFGQVFLANIPATDEKVALKFMDIRQMPALTNEYSLMSDLEGAPSIIQYKDSFVGKFNSDKTAEGLVRHKFYAVLVMEYFEGKELREYQFSGDEKEFFTLTMNLLKALATIHSVEIAHRDIKPQNILYNPKTLQVKIIDFGLAESIESDQIRGTSSYFPPEFAYLYDEERIISLSELKAGDVYAMGQTLYTCIYRCINNTVWTSAGKVRKCVQTGDFTDWKKVEDSKCTFASVINGMLECDSTKRYTIEKALTMMNLFKP